MDAEAALKKEHEIVIPFPHPHPPKDAKYTLHYERPAHINTVGSYPLSTRTKHGDDLVLDFVVTMPSVSGIPMSGRVELLLKSVVGDISREGLS